MTTQSNTSRGLTEAYCGNRLPISGECMLGCGGFGGCKNGHEDHIQPRSDLFNPLTGEPYSSGRAALQEQKK